MSKMANIQDAVMSSNKSDWETPQVFFDLLDGEFGFTLDVCATAENAKCDEYFDAVDNGLEQEWYGTCWMNPPYGRAIAPWIEKAWLESSSGAGIIVVALMAARTDTLWWHEYVMQASELRFVKGRLTFQGAKSSAPFPSVVVVWNGSNALKVTTLDWN